MSQQLAPLFWERWFERYIDVVFLIGSGIVAVSLPIPFERAGTRIVRTGVGVGLVGTGVWFLLKRGKP